MARHSHWANIKHKKAKTDAVRGRVWTKCARAIMVAAKNGGPDPDMNVTLRYAIDDARAVNMPRDTIEKAIKKGSGADSDAENYTPIRYEGYGPGGVGFLVDCLTNNVTRTAPEMREIFEKGGGRMSNPGTVAFNFQQKGLLRVPGAAATEDRLLELALDAGAEDIAQVDGVWEITTLPADVQKVKTALQAARIEPESAEITMIPNTVVDVDAAAAQVLLDLVERLEDNDDVQKVYANFAVNSDSA